MVARGKEWSSWNFAISDGEVLLATRFAYPESRTPPSLYYTKSSSLPTLKGTPRTRHIIVASEPVSIGVKWELLPRNSLLVVETGKAALEETLKISLGQFWVGTLFPPFEWGAPLLVFFIILSLLARFQTNYWPKHRHSLPGETQWPQPRVTRSQTSPPKVPQ